MKKNKILKCLFVVIMFLCINKKDIIHGQSILEPEYKFNGNIEIIKKNKINYKEGEKFFVGGEIKNIKELKDFLLLNSLYHNNKLYFKYTGKEDMYELMAYIHNIYNNSNMALWAKVGKLEKRNNIYRYELVPKSKNDKQEIIDLENYIEKWLLNNIKNNDSEEDIIKKIHDFLIMNSKYINNESGYYNGYNIKTAQSIILGHGGLCSGYADAFDKMARMAGLNTRIIINPEKTHSWNIVKVGNEWKHIDVTWDNEKSNIIYDYFLKTDEEMKKTHNWNNKYIKEEL